MVAVYYIRGCVSTHYDDTQTSSTLSMWDYSPDPVLDEEEEEDRNKKTSRASILAQRYLSKHDHSRIPNSLLPIGLFKQQTPTNRRSNTAVINFRRRQWMS